MSFGGFVCESVEYRANISGAVQKELQVNSEGTGAGAHSRPDDTTEDPGQHGRSSGESLLLKYDQSFVSMSFSPALHPRRSGLLDENLRQQQWLVHSSIAIAVSYYYLLITYSYLISLLITYLFIK
jgi:hypothetical protein